MAAENELQVRLKAKEDELNKRLQGIYMEIMAKHQKDGTAAGRRHADAGREGPHGQSSDETQRATASREKKKEEIKKELHELLKTREERMMQGMGMVGWTEDEVKRMMAARDQGTAEMEAYANEQAAAIRADLDAQREAIAARIRNEDTGGDAEAFHEEWKAKLEGQQKKMADLKEEIMEDIRKEAGRVASEKESCDDILPIPREYQRAGRNRRDCRQGPEYQQVGGAL